MLAIGLIHASLLFPRDSSERVSNKKDSAVKPEQISDVILHLGVQISGAQKDAKIMGIAL